MSRRYEEQNDCTGDKPREPAASLPCLGVPPAGSSVPKGSELGRIEPPSYCIQLCRQLIDRRTGNRAFPLFLMPKIIWGPELLRRVSVAFS